MLSHALQMHKVVSKSCLTLEDQQRFWRRLHHHILHQVDLRENRKNAVWIDVIYRPNEPWEVYLSAPPELTPYLSKWFRKDRKRVNKVEIDLSPLDDPQILTVPKGLSICELKLAFDNLFALSSDAPSILPEVLPLNNGELARISFCLRPIPAVMWNVHKTSLFESKMQEGIRMGRGRVEAAGWVRVLLFYLGQWLGRIFSVKRPSMPDVNWLSQGTLRKLNDSHFETNIRIVAPQRLIPKLARPFQGEGGENHLVISFMPRNEEKSIGKELERQRLSLLTRSDLNPNILGSREISSLLSFFPRIHEIKQEKASPNLQ